MCMTRMSGDGGALSTWLADGFARDVRHVMRHGMGVDANLVARRFRGVFWQALYEALGRYTRRQGIEFSTMNFGFDDDTLPAGVDDVLAEHPERYGLQLYRRVVAGEDLTGRDLVDVSCGRGGGLFHLHTTLHPRTSRGIDLAAVNVGISAGLPAVPGLSHQVGSALALPMPDRDADVVVSVEASHCYPSIPAFVQEAARVLRDDGLLGWVDFEQREEGEPRTALARRHFHDVLEVDLTAGVLSSMHKDQARRRALIRTHTARPLWRALDHFAASADDVDTVTRFREGRFRYVLRQCRRPRREVAHG
jgi:SAM-dependent methyltransferase